MSAIILSFVAAITAAHPSFIQVDHASSVSGLLAAEFEVEDQRNIRIHERRVNGLAVLVSTTAADGKRTVVGLLVCKRSKRPRGVRLVAATAFSANSAYSFQFGRESRQVDLDKDQIKEIAVVEHFDWPGASMSATAYWKVSGKELIPVYYITREFYRGRHREQRDFRVLKTGRIRERITVCRTGPNPCRNAHNEFDIRLKWDGLQRRFAPIRVRVLP
jgi:hypothetical protein